MEKRINFEYQVLLWDFRVFFSSVVLDSWAIDIQNG
jgi:hypothetical protein